MGKLVDVVFVLQYTLSSQGCPCIEQLVGNHGGDCHLARVGDSSAVVLGLGSLAGPDCLSHLWDHGQDTCRQLLVAQVRQTGLLLLRTFTARVRVLRNINTTQIISAVEYRIKRSGVTYWLRHFLQSWVQRRSLCDPHQAFSLESE